MSRSPQLPRGRRRFLRHIVLGVDFVAVTAIFMQLFPKRDTISGISIGTAYSALFLIGTTLVLGPWNVLRGRANPVSYDLRRDVGIWAGIAALVHTVVGLNVHLRGKPWLYFVDQQNRLRTDMFGFANYTGLIASLVFAIFLGISNDASLRRLGAVKWKSIQRWSYAAVLLTAAHAIAFQNVEKRTVEFRLLLYGVIAAMLTLQVAGMIRRKHPRQTGAPTNGLAAQPADSSLPPHNAQTRRVVGTPVARNDTP